MKFDRRQRKLSGTWEEMAILRHSSWLVLPQSSENIEAQNFTNQNRLENLIKKSKCKKLADFENNGTLTFSEPHDYSVINRNIFQQ